MMKILLCPDKFKGSLSAQEVCHSLREGIQSTNDINEIFKIPMADGGDGSIEILKSRLKLSEESVRTIDPIGREIAASYYFSEDSAFIELASASGLTLLNQYERNPLFASTRGTGLMIKDAIQKGFTKIYLFIGGSATNDAGIGIAQVLGFDFLSEHEEQLEPIGYNLEKIRKIVDHQLFDFRQMEFNVLCDVNNPMHGPQGAAHIYAAQKGANEEQIKILDQGLKNFDAILNQQFNVNLATIPGMGAAGAVGASLKGLLGAELHHGFQVISNLLQLEEQIQNADLIITGEGKVDASSFDGKVVGNVLALCQKHNKPCGLVGGIIDEIAVNTSHFIFHHSIISLANTQEDAMAKAKKYLSEIGEKISRFKYS